MAAIHIKSDAQRQQEQRILESFGVNEASAQQRECAEQIAHEAQKYSSMGGKDNANH